MNEKKSVGILTFQWAGNFGALLQTCATKTWLEQNGYSPVVINYAPAVLRGREWFLPYPPRKGLKRKIGYTVKGFLRNLYTGRPWFRHERKIQRFRRERLGITGRAIRSKGGLSTVRVDALLFGSDQVWNPDITCGLRPAYFGAYRNSQVQRTVAYAASFGNSALRKEHEAQFAELLALVDCVAMRERSAAAYVRKRFQRDVACVVDPVALLRVEDWHKLAQAPEERNYILYYPMNNHIEIEEYLCQLSEKCGMNVVILTRYKRKYPPAMHPQVVYDASPEQFLGYLRAANYVVTDSFHATIFSILFHRKVLCWMLPGLRSARIRDLLKDVGLEYRIADLKGVPDIDSEIDWASVDARLDRLRIASAAFLRDSLSF